MLKVQSFGQTDTGLKRSNNEDSFLCHPDLALWAVADGMGGAASGEVASRIFVDTAFEVFSGIEATAAKEDSLIVQEIFRIANERIFLSAKNNRQYHGMGCTAELLAFSGEDYLVGHVGDSRTYLFRDGDLKQLTRDHSLVQDQLDRGLITVEEAKNHALRNVILRAVGVEEALAVDFIRGGSFPGERWEWKKPWPSTSSGAEASRVISSSFVRTGYLPWLRIRPSAAFFPCRLPYRKKPKN
ncbi:MAG: protein serine/threonine phosphatase [Deltaproteobacteria bacterium]|nr:protein serine/threonine phosphatase [Deltaproteobacteria bacterium]